MHDHHTSTVSAAEFVQRAGLPSDESRDRTIDEEGRRLLAADRAAEAATARQRAAAHDRGEFVPSHDTSVLVDCIAMSLAQRAIVGVDTEIESDEVFYVFPRNAGSAIDPDAVMNALHEVMPYAVAIDFGDRPNGNRAIRVEVSAA